MKAPDNTGLIAASGTVTFQRWNGENFNNHGEWATTQTDIIYIRHDMNVDKVRITMELHPKGTTYSVQSGDVTGSPTTIITLPTWYRFVQYSGDIEVYKNGKLLDSSVDYSVSSSTGDSLLMDTITLVDPVTIGASPLDSIDIVYKTSTLIDHPNDAVSALTNNIAIFGGDGSTDLLRTVFPISMTIWGISENKDVLNPMKIIDKKSNIVVSPVPIWNPSRGIHYYQGINVVDVQTDTDPAIYDDGAWNSNEVGTVWMDTSELDYRPYADEAAFPEAG